MPDRCTIRRRVRARGTLGGSKASFVDQRTDVPCWQQQTSSAEAAEFEKKGIVVSTKVYFTSDPGVTARHQILMTSRNGTAVTGETPLDVVDSPSPDVSVGRGLLWRVACSINRGEDD
jgi:hypothetical protein